MRHQLRRLVLVPFALGLAGALSAQTPIPDDVRTNMQSRVTNGLAVGIVIGVVDSAGTRYFTAGSPTLSGGRPLDQRTMFEIGSITKVFTAVTLAGMVRTGQVGLDDPVQQRLPGGSFVPSRNGKEITLRLLSAQRSGLPRMPGNFAPRDPANPYADYGSTQLLGFLSQLALTRDPGASYEYSNLGVGLLGFALANTAGTSYERLVTQRVLQPLGMSSSMITLTPDARARLAQPHQGGSPSANWDLDALAGAGALRSDAEDMLRFLAAAMGLRSTPLDSAFALTFQVQGDAGSPAMDIGLGWHILKRPAVRIVWHNGGTGGYRTWAGFDPARKVGVVVLSNNTMSIDDIGFHMFDAAIPLAVARAAIELPAESLEAYVGRYQLAPNFVIEVTRTGAQLFGQATGQPAFRLWPSAVNEFFLRDVEARVSFARDSTGRVASMVLHQNGRDTPGPKI